MSGRGEVPQRQQTSVGTLREMQGGHVLPRVVVDRGPNFSHHIGGSHSLRIVWRVDLSVPNLRAVSIRCSASNLAVRRVTDLNLIEGLKVPVVESEAQDTTPHGRSTSTHMAPAVVKRMRV